MADKFVILDHTSGPLLKTGQTTDRTPAGRTTKDDGGFQRGILGSKLDAQYEILTVEQYSGTTDITVNGKTDTHSNECVFDKITGLMWSRTLSAAVFGTSTENLFWDDTGGSDEDIFKYCDQANLANLSAFSDWRVPNILEIYNLMLAEASSGRPNTVAFPTWGNQNIWTSTSRPSDTNRGVYIAFSSLFASATGKTGSRFFTALVRLGINDN